MIDEKIVSIDRVQKLNTVADFELRSIGAFYNELDHPQIGIWRSITVILYRHGY